MATLQSSESPLPPAAAANTITPSEQQSVQDDQQLQLQRQDDTRLPIRTYHCTFCKQILLATTRDVDTLARRRRGEGLDVAVILPLRANSSSSKAKTKTKTKGGKGKGKGGDVEDGGEQEGQEQDEDDEEEDGDPDEEEEEEEEEEDSDDEHYTILLSTTTAAPTASIVRRRDGFEKRLLLRCGRCRLVCGYVLDSIHFPGRAGQQQQQQDEEGDQIEAKDGDDGGGGGGEEAEVVYLLPSAVIETGEMMRDSQNRIDTAEWEIWEKLVPKPS